MLQIPTHIWNDIAAHYPLKTKMFQEIFKKRNPDSVSRIHSLLTRTMTQKLNLSLTAALAILTFPSVLPGTRSDRGVSAQRTGTEGLPASAVGRAGRTLPRPEGQKFYDDRGRETANTGSTGNIQLPRMPTQPQVESVGQSVPRDVPQALPNAGTAGQATGDAGNNLTGTEFTTEVER